MKIWRDPPKPKAPRILTCPHCGIQFAAHWSQRTCRILACLDARALHNRQHTQVVRWYLNLQAIENQLYGPRSLLRSPLGAANWDVRRFGRCKIP